MVREGRVFVSPAGVPVYGIGYYVQALEMGAQVTSASSGTTVTVRSGHGFAAGDKYMNGTDTSTFSATLTVQSVDATHLYLSSNYSVSEGDLLVNLGVDSSTGASPNYDGAGLIVYTTQDYTATATNNTVTTDSYGRYRYYHKGIVRWELVRGSSGPIALYVDTSEPSDGDQVSYFVRYAHLFAASGTGTSADPWPGACITAAWNDLPAYTNGKIILAPGVFDLGSGSIGLNLDSNGAYATGFVLEGFGGGNQQTSSVNPTLADYGATVLKYSGTGEAIRVGEFATTGGQFVENYTLRGFKVRQTGTAGTGIGILARLFRWGTIDDVTIVNFSVGLALASVSDFNVITIMTRDCTTSHVDLGRSTTASGAALLGPNGQSNSNRFLNCNIANSSRSLGYTNNGVFIHANAVGSTFRDSEFHNFDTSGSSAIYINEDSSDSAVTLVDANYFEGNYHGVYHNNAFGAGTDLQGLSVTNNYITQITGFGVLVNSGSTGTTNGICVVGNTFINPSNSAPYATAVGVQLGTYITNAKVSQNTFKVGSVLGTLGGGNVIASVGVVTHDEFIHGSLRTSGACKVDGALTVTGNIAGSGSIRGLKATEALTTSAAITTAGRMLIDITNTSGSNTPTLVAPSSVDGQILILRCVALTAGTITLADSGTCSLSAAWVPNADDTLTLIASGTIWYEIARSAN